MSWGHNSLWLELKMTSSLDGVHALAPPLSGRAQVCLRRLVNQSVGHGSAGASSLFFLSCSSSRSSMPSTHEAIEGRYTPARRGQGCQAPV